MFLIATTAAIAVKVPTVFKAEIFDSCLYVQAIDGYLLDLTSLYLQIEHVNVDHKIHRGPIKTTFLLLLQ